MPLLANVFVEASICRLVSRFTCGSQMAHKNKILLSIRMELFYFSQACSEDVFNFFLKQTNDYIVLFQSLWMFF